MRSEDDSGCNAVILFTLFTIRFTSACIIVSYIHGIATNGRGFIPEGYRNLGDHFSLDNILKGYQSTSSYHHNKVELNWLKGLILSAKFLGCLKLYGFREIAKESGIKRTCL